ncbi:MAG TPA: ribonuclease HII [Candidatus Absconditabacterales bacterium]|nr:ribonuclease HII [Candidatus Absconditabacterales bacterium]
MSLKKSSGYQKTWKQFSKKKAHDCLVFFVDEAGRGPLAGPVTVGVVALTGKVDSSLFRDSKLCSESERENLYEFLVSEKKLFFASGRASADFIDRYGIVKALQKSIIDACKKIILKMENSVSKKNMKLSEIKFWMKENNVLLVIDGNSSFGLDKKLDIEVAKIIDGDALVAEIAMASIVAKVERDDFMKKLAKRYPGYGFEIHKGYGTVRHRVLIRECGLSKIHRKTYCKKILES